MVITILIFGPLWLADSLYANGYYEPAVTEYKRAFFFYPELYRQPTPRLHYAIALFKNNQYQGGREFQKLIDDFPNLEAASKVVIAKEYLSRGDYYRASELLSQTPDKRLLGLTYLLEERFITARNLFITTGEYELAEEVNRYLTRPKKSVTKATILSAICPGAGEIYAGNIRLGIFDFLITWGTGYLLYDALKDKRYVDAGLIFNFLFHRFYLGSIANAQHAVYKKNEKDKEDWLNEIKMEYLNSH